MDRFVSACFLGSMAFISSSIFAAERVVLHKASANKLLHFRLTGTSTVLLNQSNTFKLIKQHIDTKNVKYIRMQQEYLGFPVIGGEIILHQLPNQLLPQAMSTGVIYRQLEQELNKPPEHFLEQAPYVLQNFKKPYHHKLVTKEGINPVVYINEQHQAFWAYQIKLTLQPQQAIPKHIMAFLDAKTGQVLLEWDDIKTSYTPVKGMGFGGNRCTGQYQFGRDLPLLNIERDTFLETCYLKNDLVNVVDMEERYIHPSTPMEFKCLQVQDEETKPFWLGYASDGFDQKNGAYSPSNDAMYIATVINDMFKQWYQTDALAYNGKPRKFIMRVHYGRNYENAFWDGQQMTFGDGSDIIYPLVSLGIGAHEISHGFTEQHSNLAYYSQSGGINESFSDMAAQAAEYFVKGKNNWKIGAEILKKRSGYQALRYMDKPTRDGYSIEHVDDYQPGMDVHYSSGVFNYLFYLLANRPGWDTRKAFHAMLKANMEYWISSSNFEDAGCGVMYAAEDLNFPVHDVEYALDKVGIDYEACKA